VGDATRYTKERLAVIATARQLNEQKLSLGMSGNVSVQVDDGLLITPSGFPYSSLKPEDIVHIAIDGRILSGHLKPSSEWQFHAAVYRDKPATGAIVHAHSDYATALACAHLGIPAFHYMVAMAGGKDIPCAGYATFGSAELAEEVAKALHQRKACLLANHGMIATGEDLQTAFELALEVEQLARQYVIVRQTAEPIVIPDDEMERVLQKFESYGR